MPFGQPYLTFKAIEGCRSLHTKSSPVLWLCSSRCLFFRFPESMDWVGPILTIATDLFDCTAKRASHIRGLRENLDCLREEMEQLIRRSEDVEKRVELEKQQQMTPRREVEGWLQDVSDEKREVAVILDDGHAVLEKKFLGRCCNIRSSYNFGKRVSRKIRRVKELTSRGDFEEVAYRLPCARAAIDELPLGPTVGLDLLCEFVRSRLTKDDVVISRLTKDDVVIIGLYGIRGIGKTTLMKKINNDLLERGHDFDTVIWVPVSKRASVRAAQKVIGNKLQIIDSTWQNRSQDEKAIEIFNILKTKRFLLLLDNVQKPLDLSKIGVPLHSRNRSKVIIATRSIRICPEIKVENWFEVRPLQRIHALELFIQLVGKDNVYSSPEMQLIRDQILEGCKGVPSAIIRAGRALASCEKAWDSGWITELMHIIDEDISGKDRLPLAVGDEMPLGHTVGLDSLYVSVYNCLTQYQQGIIGLYGTGGVGKTTLMKKINNTFLKTRDGFDTVIWVAMSKQANVRGGAQEVIRNKLQIPDSMWQSRTEDQRAREILNTMKTKKFLLLLDDVWQPLNLSEIGVPPLPEIRNGSKVIITTRFQKICNEMEVPLQFRVDFLEREEALALFREKVGESTLNSHPDIPQLSEKVAEWCKGLPLALVTVGRTMADKNSPEAWDQAIQELEKFPAEISGMEEGLFHVLKLSYDSLRDDITKSCFIYCSCFPKEYEIRNDELIEHWIGEGFFDGKDIYEARRRGHKIIEDLKNACLLEKGDGFKECIKMHDVIHDMALWISQECGKKMNKILVCECLGLVDAERVTNWKEAESISLWGRNIEKLPETPNCSNLQTLFVRECIQLKTFPRGFFQFMPLIRVLDLSATHCLTKLHDEIDRLMNLEYINLSMTNIRELPIGIMKLTKLRCLLLDGMPQFVIPPHVISSLSSLQLFSMYDGNALSVHRQALLEELESIERLDELSLSFHSVEALKKLLTSYKLQRCMRRLSLHDCRDLLLLQLSSIFLNYLETVVIVNCLQLEEMKITVDKEESRVSEKSYDIPNPELIVRNNQHFRRLHDVKIWNCPKLWNLTWLIYAAHLQSLNVQFCKSMKEVISNEYVTSSTQHVSIFTRLTSLVLGAMPMLESIHQGALLFPSLEIISVINCPRLRRLPFDSNSAAKSLKKIEGDTAWWEGLDWEDESTEDIFINYFSPQYLADPIQDSEEVKGKKILVVEGSTSSAAT